MAGHKSRGYGREEAREPGEGHEIEIPAASHSLTGGRHEVQTNVGAWTTQPKCGRDIRGCAYRVGSERPRKVSVKGGGVPELKIYEAASVWFRVRLNLPPLHHRPWRPGLVLEVDSARTGNTILHT
jgi:hypothetical protein